ncbi:hypothetical protein A1O1_07734 [Capronia coronata CBS 617.96]|uniref:Ima1 N-terminal domain-containing protein n=1 Tax=Capronia coronata CBS 617.96 TaxID=1182541 RepID=W9YHB2_9EURO|nr:uncharacterized protein A1O1_07734 [Capronia coronata CBS 617.96]EXJ81669.1 hypothetical protein A1O1_07734 [Capronia coronata CBS 617.96]
MPVQLRQRLDCHYCGRRSKHSKKQDRKFQCEHCLAVNFFDENGEIADVPAEEVAPTQQRYAQPVISDPLADDFTSPDSIFCSTCLKNQQLYTYNLSQFLPDPDHPDYDKLEAQLPEYKKGLELRYPQCCARCEPRVRAQLHQATYNARSDHLRRVLEKSRQRRIASRLGWRSLLVTAAGLAYFSSLAMQLVWHLYGSQVSRRTPTLKLRPLDCLTHRPFVSECLDIVEPLVGLSLNLGLLSIWWNPRWQYRLSTQEGNLSGLKQYYLVQMALLGLRFSAWIVLVHVPLDPKVRCMLHACFAVAIAVIAGWSVYAIIEVKTSPAVNWQQDPAQLLSSNQFVPPSGPAHPGTQDIQSGPFSIGTLATPPPPAYKAWKPPTPPEDSAELMDWTPSQPTFEPELKELRYRSTGPSPFHGTLPALNVRGVHKNATARSMAQKEAIGLPPGFFDRPTDPALPSRKTESKSDAIAQPKFFGHDREADTGLESIFGTVFSLQDRSLDPNVPTSKSTVASSHSYSYSKEPLVTSPPTSKIISFGTRFSRFSFALILIAVAAWTFEATLSPNPSELGYYIVLLSVSIPVGHVAYLLASGGIRTRLSRLLLFTLEAILLLGIAMLREPFGELFRDLWNKLGIAVVGLLLPQEFLHMNHSSSDTGPAHEHYETETPVPPSTETIETRHSPIPSATPTLSRRDSTESIESRSSIATTSTAWEWQTPKLSRGRYELLESSSSATPRSTGANVGSRQQQLSDRNLLGIDGLTLSDRASAGSPSNSGRRTSRWGVESSGTNIAGPRARRRG